MEVRQKSQGLLVWRPAAWAACSTTCKRSLNACMPPIFATATQASTMTIPIFRMNWNRSVTSTPQSPPMEVYIPVNGIRIRTQMRSAVCSACPACSSAHVPAKSQLHDLAFAYHRAEQHRNYADHGIGDPSQDQAIHDQAQINGLESSRKAAGLPLYRISVDSTSVKISDRRQYRAKKKTVSMPPRQALHQIQFPAMPAWLSLRSQTEECQQRK